MEFIKFPVVYTKTTRKEPRDSGYNSVLAELNIDVEEDTETVEVEDYIYIQQEALQNVSISPYIKGDKVIQNRSILEYGDTANEVRVFMMVRLPVEALLDKLRDV